MAGFGAAAKQDKMDKQAEKATPSKQVEAEDVFASLAKERNQLKSVRPRSHQFVALAGHDGTGKSALVLDAYKKDPHRTEKDELWSMDFDSGVMMLHDAIYPEDRTIVNFDPWVMQVGERTANDYPATHKRVLDITKYAIDIAQKQLDPEYDGQRIWGLLVSGVDYWDQICVNNMRITDLGLAKDGIEAADIRGAGDASRVDKQWDWAMRKTRFHQLTFLCQKLVKLGVRVYWETHLKKTNYSWGDGEKNSKWRPDWEKSTGNRLPTILMCERVDTLGDDGEVARSEVVVSFEKSKTAPDLLMQRRTVLITKAGEKAEWRGLPELYDGSL